MIKQLIFTLSSLILLPLTLHAATATTKIYGTGDAQQDKGTIEFKDSPGGLMIKPSLHDLPPGPHGFHIHQIPNCRHSGMAAGGHFDPENANTHLGPYDKGHLGDLPVLYVNADGESKTSLLAPRLSVEDIIDHSIVIHAAGDNYSDTPPLGGGGPRIACGVIR